MGPGLQINIERAAYGEHPEKNGDSPEKGPHQLGIRQTGAQGKGYGQQGTPRGLDLPVKLVRGLPGVARHRGNVEEEKVGGEAHDSDLEKVQPALPSVHLRLGAVV